LREVLAILPERPLLAGQGLRLSLAGAQSKVPVVLVGGAVALPAGAQPTTHIVKPPIKRFPATTENEAFVMRLAATIGLDVAAVEPRVLGSQTLLLVERYDRRIDANGHVRRLHQEDFCQALGFPPERKYASEGGPTIKDCFSLLRRVSVRPAADVLRLLDAVIFNVVVGNADAHGKNFSLLYDSDGPQLAPLYDLLSTVFYPRLSAVFAMKIGRRSTLGDLDAKGWARFAEDAGISRQLLRRRVLTICQQVRSGAADVAASINAVGFDQDALTSLAETTATRGAACETSLDR
jgi:serine/threonine-protein kinase HipA